MAISVTLNPIPTIRLSASTPTVAMSITGNAVARFSQPLSIRWGSIVDAPAELVNIGDLTTTGFITRTDSNGAISTRTLQAPAAGFTITNPAGVAGDPTFALANDLAAYEGLATAGLVARTGDGTAATRTITGPAAGITVSNGDGVSGNPTLALANDLAALEAMASTGLVARTAAETYAQRSLANATAGITWTNADGVSGNPTPVLANDLAALEGLGSTGFAARTTTDTWAQRTLSAPAAGFTITNPAGIAGNPTFALADDLAGLEGMSGTGLVARTASNTYAQRTLTAPAAGITVSNGDGISGNPTLALANDLSALEAMAGTGLVARTASETYAQRTLTAPAAGITVSNGNGVSGNPTLALADDLAALEALSGTNTIYYRSAASTWTAVTIGSNLTFSGGTLASTGGGTEATWTPVLTFGTPGDLSVTYSTQVGNVTRIGNLVFAQFNIVTSAFTHTTASGNLTVTGLPHTSKNVTGQQAVGSMLVSGITKATYTQFVPKIVNNSADILIGANGSGVGNTNVTFSDVPTGGTVVLRGSIMYEAQ